MDSRTQQPNSEPTASSWASFKNDLARAIGVWAKAPLLPITSLSLGIIVNLYAILQSGSSNPGRALVLMAAYPVLLLVSCFSLGWVGTERVWYLRGFREKSLRPAEAWTITWRFFPRYLVLGLVAGILIMPAAIWAFSSLLPQFADPDRTSVGTSTQWDLLLEVPGRFLTLVVLMLVADFLLTFVTPALAFTTRSVREALRIGIRMIFDEWPGSLWYVLIPPLAIWISVRLVPVSAQNYFASVIGTGLATLLNLWFKGGVAAFYLRRFDVGDSGAVSQSRRQSRRLVASKPGSDRWSGWEDRQGRGI